MSNPIDPKKVCQEIQKASMSASRVANSLPPIEDFAYHNSFPEYSNAMTAAKDKINSLMNSIAKNYKCKTIKPLTKAKGDSEKFETICDLNDLLLDRASNWMDEAEGLKKKNSELVIATLSKSVPTCIKSSTVANATPGQNDSETTKTYQLLGSKMVQRPQVEFKDTIDNSVSTPFVPKISYKPNSIKPLAILPETMSDGRICYCHPYEFEIEKFEPSTELLSRCPQPSEPPPLAQTPFDYVDTLDKLNSMVQELSNCSEIAIDLEHHSFRTYQGFTCTIQISSRSPNSKSSEVSPPAVHHDYLIDALKLRSHLHLLNEVTTNPKILKVLHGADMDILWLQRDFGVYIVNMFDTGQAARVLGLAHFSLAHLLKSYCGIDADKQFQLADWRMRPLPEQLINYARSDTHSLLYIYDQLKNQLIDRGNQTNNLLRNVFTRSSGICLKRYEKPITDGDSYLKLIQRTRLPMNPRQLHCLEQLFQWRESIARAEDESTGFVLPNHMLLQMATLLPREIQGIVACCNPVPPLVKQNLNALHAIIYKAREVPLEAKDHVRLTNQSNDLLKKKVNHFEKHDDAHLDETLIGILDSLGNEVMDTTNYETDTLNEQERRKVISRLASCFPERKRFPPKVEEIFISPYERMMDARKKPPKVDTEPMATDAMAIDVKSNEQVVTELFEASSQVSVPEEEMEQFLGPIKKLKSESKMADKNLNSNLPPIPVHDYKSQVETLFKNSEKSGKMGEKKKFYDPHGDYMRDAKRGGKGGGRSRSRR